jgi:hypothetical protein
MGEQGRDLELQDVGLAEIADPDGAAANLVLVGRADATPRRADLDDARRILAPAVESGCR